MPAAKVKPQKETNVRAFHDREAGRWKAENLPPSSDKTAPHP
jgi:hypothetical protein